MPRRGKSRFGGGRERERACVYESGRGCAGDRQTGKIRNGLDRCWGCSFRFPWPLLGLAPALAKEDYRCTDQLILHLSSLPCEYENNRAVQTNSVSTEPVTVISLISTGAPRRLPGETTAQSERQGDTKGSLHKLPKAGLAGKEHEQGGSYWQGKRTSNSTSVRRSGARS